MKRYRSFLIAFIMLLNISVPVHAALQDMLGELKSSLEKLHHELTAVTLPEPKEPPPTVLG